MAAGKGSRTLLLKLVADTDQFQKGTKKASGAFGKFGAAIKGAAAGAALAIAGFAAKWAGDAVQAAIAAEKVERRFAKTLQNVTKATDAQIAATEEYISKTQLATGINDDELRQSFERLIRITRNNTKAQKLQAIALDFAAGAGISLEAATKAIVRAQSGSFTALTRQGVKLDETTIKTKNVDEAMRQLAQTFKGQSAEAADTSAGKFQILQEQLGEIQEQLGVALLPYLTKFSDWLTEEGLLAIQTFFDVLTGKEVDESKFTELQTTASELATAFKNVATEIGNIYTQLDLGNPKSGFNSMIQVLADAVELLGDMFEWLDKIGVEIGPGGPFYEIWSALNGKQSATSRTLQNWMNMLFGASPWAPSTPSGRYLTPEENSRMRGQYGVNVVVNGAVDPAATAKAVQQALARADRMGGYSWAGKGTG